MQNSWWRPWIGKDNFVILKCNLHTIWLHIYERQVNRQSSTSAVNVATTTDELSTAAKEPSAVNLSKEAVEQPSFDQFPPEAHRRRSTSQRLPQKGGAGCGCDAVGCTLHKKFHADQQTGHEPAPFAIRTNALTIMLPRP
ncbi:hypothetical protein evm_001212 [Chilo suppressalis]|nr:hypothetical protein evm_001212 [Chilo suppressalis]